jgi:hypothetical protein
MGSVALVLSILVPSVGNWWYALTLLSPAAWWYYFQKGERTEQVRGALCLCVCLSLSLSVCVCVSLSLSLCVCVLRKWMFLCVCVCVCVYDMCVGLGVARCVGGLGTQRIDMLIGGVA